jgi:hypothetical protein
MSERAAGTEVNKLALPSCLLYIRFHFMLHTALVMP